MPPGTSSAAPKPGLRSTISCQGKVRGVQAQIGSFRGLSTQRNSRGWPTGRKSSLRCPEQPIKSESVAQQPIERRMAFEEGRGVMSDRHAGQWAKGLGPRGGTGFGGDVYVARSFPAAESPQSQARGRGLGSIQQRLQPEGLRSEAGGWSRSCSLGGRAEE